MSNAARSASRTRPRPAADHSVLVGRGARAQRRAVAVGLAPAVRLAAHLTTDPAGGTALRWLIERSAWTSRPPPSWSTTRPRRTRRSAACPPRTRSCSSASSMRSAACNWSFLALAHPAAPGGWRCASASAQVQLRAAGRGDRGHDRALADHGAQFRARRGRPYLSSATVRQVLIQALLDAPMFITRWRWVGGVALALPRFRGGKKVAPQLARRPRI